MPTGQQYATNVPQTTLTGSINASATSFSVASSASWPSVPFTAVLDIGTSTQEPVDVTAVVGTTWSVTRNIDGTTGFSHAIGATVTHADIGRDFREARTHMDASTNVHGLTGGAAVVGDTQTQTLTNKTITSPSIGGTVAGGASYTSPSITGTVGGSATYTAPTLNQAVIGAVNPNTPAGNNLALYSAGGALSVKDSTGAATAVTQGSALAIFNGLLWWAFDPAMVVSPSLALTSGTVTYSKITICATTVVSNIVLYLTAGGSTLTSGQNLVGIYDSSGVRQALSADQSASWTTTGTKTISVGPVTLHPGDYYIAILSNGTSPISINSSASNASMNAGITSAPYRANFSAGGQTSLASSITLGGLTQQTVLGWCGLK